MPSVRLKKTEKGWNGVEHISIWFMLMILIYWEKSKNIMKNIEVVLVGLEVKAKGNMYIYTYICMCICTYMYIYMFMSGHQDVGHKDNIT